MHPILYFSVFSQPTKQQFQERLSYVKQSRDVQKSQSHLESLVEGIAAIPLRKEGITKHTTGQAITLRI